MTEPNPTPPPRWRPRISLLAAILLMTIAGMGIVMARNWRESAAQHQEILRLRAELGYLSIDNENLIYAKQIDINEPDTRRFRIYLPKNRKFKLYVRMLSVPGRQANESNSDWLATVLKTMKKGGNQDIQNGEFTFEVQIRQNQIPKEHWELHYHEFGTQSNSTAAAPGLTDRRGWTISSDVGLGKQQAMKPDDGLVLFALREGEFTEHNGRYSAIKSDETKESPGVMLWVAPADDSKGS